ncbi:unnamed protein product [Microthlaspi erraticum]|uniref:Transmembrane protein n=1 Tax=Microthlaspi erraticum TaxID=1685480 RepID=A0A6D2IAG5_9BRAS|nr:unnamed protein product [Microthlaspi erraticum]
MLFTKEEGADISTYLILTSSPIKLLYLVNHFELEDVFVAAAIVIIWTFIFFFRFFDVFFLFCIDGDVESSSYLVDVYLVIRKLCILEVFLWYVLRRRFLFYGFWNFTHHRFLCCCHCLLTFHEVLKVFVKAYLVVEWVIGPAVVERDWECLSGVIEAKCEA